MFNRIFNKDIICRALGEGLFLFLKYGLIIILILVGLIYYNDMKMKAENGNQAAIAINEYIKNGYLPSFPLTPKK